MRLAIVGAGNLGVAIPSVIALAGYFGERPLALRLWDPDPERLDLTERFARAAFRFNRAGHEVESFSELDQAVEAPDRVLFCPDSHGTRLWAVWSHHEGDPLEAMLAKIPETALVAALLAGDPPLPRPTYRFEGWPEPGPEGPAQPLQVLRWIRGEDYLHEELARHAKSPLKAWLDNPLACPLTPSART